MRNLLTITGLAAAALSYATTAAVVHVDANDADTLYNYAAAAAAFNYADGARLCREPLFTDDAAEVRNYEGAAAAVWAIGGPNKYVVADACASYGVAENKVVAVDGDPFAVAAALALRWTVARDVVVAPCVADDADAQTGALAAAALAAALNAPVLYTRPGWTPAETTTALARLGARRVYLVDFGGLCSDRARAELASGGRVIAREFAHPSEVDGFAATRLLSEQKKTNVLSI